MVRAVLVVLLGGMPRQNAFGGWAPRPSLLPLPPPLRQLPPALPCPPCPSALPLSPAPLPPPSPAAALTKGDSANLACHLNLILARRDTGNATATALLRAMYTAWRAVHQPQRWHPAAASEAKWLANLRFVASVNTLMGNKWWAGLNSYSDLSAEEFAATVLQTSAQAGVQQAAATAATKGRSSTGTAGARKLLARYVPPKPDYPIVINWATAGKVSVGEGRGHGPAAQACARAGFSSPARQCPLPLPLAHHRHLSSLSPCPLPSYSKQVLPQVSFQGQCASSWAFAAAAALESRLMIGTGTNTTAVLSAQHIMVRRLGGWVGVMGQRLESGMLHRCISGPSSRQRGSSGLPPIPASAPINYPPSPVPSPSPCLSLPAGLRCRPEQLQLPLVHRRLPGRRLCFCRLHRRGD